MTLRLYNTMSRRVEEVKQPDDALKIYVCGITPYDHSHIGHAMSYIIFDVLRRYLEHRGFKVKHVQNYTDIDDRIIARAAERGVPYDQLAAEFIEEYEEEMRELNITPADIYPRATQEIPQIIEMVQGLIEKGRAYAVESGDVYFDVRSDPGYGKLSGRDVDSMRAGARVEPGEEKHDPADFALWKAAKPGEPSWESPWGPGRPGWHIECSAMSYKYLGDTLDIHTGGEDNIFPHHECEIAQSECALGLPFVRHWLHNGWLTLDEEKMSKSIGNIITIREALDRYGSDGIRIFVMTSHYRAPLAYSGEALEAGKRAAERLHLAASVPGGDGPAADISGDDYRERFGASMDDDLNTAGALASLFDLAREINRARDDGRAVDEAQATLRQLAAILGLTLRERETAQGADAFIDLLVELRSDLRDEKQFALSDKVRDRLLELGITLEDVQGGTRWRRRD